MKKVSTYAVRRLRTQRKRTNACRDCGLPVTPGHARCDGCLKRCREYQKKRRATGVCAACRSPAVLNGLCKDCRVKKREAERERYQKRVRASLCPQCGKRCDTSRRLCRKCLYRHKGYAATSGSRRHTSLRIRCLDAYGHRCVCCGETSTVFLVIDHVNGGGTKHRKWLKSQGLTFYQWLELNGFPQEGFRCLCHNCNAAFASLGECPHQQQPPL